MKMYEVILVSNYWDAPIAGIVKTNFGCWFFNCCFSEEEDKYIDIAAVYILSEFEDRLDVFKSGVTYLEQSNKALVLLGEIEIETAIKTGSLMKKIAKVSFQYLKRGGPEGKYSASFELVEI